MAERINKARYWWAVLYPENMIEDWESKIADLLQLPFAYAVHTSDIDSKSEHRKDHVHLIVVFPNTTTYNHAMQVFALLNADGKQAFNTIQACVNIRHCYDYLIHDTESCKKEDKFLYPASHRVTGNNFDIGAYEQIGLAERRNMVREMADYVIEFKIQNMVDAYVLIGQNFEDEYLDILASNHRFIESITRGNFQKYGMKKKDEGTER